MSEQGKYFNIQFNRDRIGEAEFEEKLRKMAKTNNLTLADTVMMLVMAVNQFKLSYNVSVDLTEEKSSEKRSEPMEMKQEVQHSILDALKDKR